ncbi:sugar phosphate isomerase/epimerase family protein [Cellulosilyticum ruminicola]|uniref:sugar phosphate isomerase/epimerase family protein n=1 Tax=Cellulosilyticum ruminicola TaxID=425254 RepID=UPI0006D0731B|nr:sugar phosphate isomerase/epimerase family protein [Cellulosilyticum ruminicola]
MYIGLRAHDYGKSSLEDLFSRIVADGFHHIQLAIPKAIEGVGSIEEVDEKLIKDIKAACEKYDIKISVFGCYVELGKLDAKERQKHVNRFLLGMDIAKALGADCIGSETTHFDIHGSDEERRAAFEGLVDSVRQVVKKGEEIGLDVAIEPVALHTLNTPELTKELLERVPSKRLKIIFDPVNLLTKDNIAGQEDLWNRAFEIFGHKICALHMKGTRLDENGELEKTNLQDNEANFKRIIDWMKVNKPEVTVLREEIKPVEAKADYALINSLI